jgi:hypothetical protein
METITVRPGLTARVLEYLMTGYEMRKPPVATAAILAVVLELHARQQPFPARRVVAAAAGCSIDAVDAALSVSLSRGLVRLRIEVIDGVKIRYRESSVRIRYYDPDPELIALVSPLEKGRNKPSKLSVR